MAKVVKHDIIHRREIRVHLEWPDVKRALRDLALQQIHIPLSPDDERMTVDFNLKQLEEGSPSYKVSKWEAFVNVDLDLREKV